MLRSSTRDLALKQLQHFSAFAFFSLGKSADAKRYVAVMRIPTQYWLVGRRNGFKRLPVDPECQHSQTLPTGFLPPGVGLFLVQRIGAAESFMPTLTSPEALFCRHGPCRAAHRISNDDQGGGDRRPNWSEGFCRPT